MQFEEIFKLIINEQEKPKEEEYQPEPWSLEIRKDFSKSEAYNELGDLIIRLFELRARLK